MNTQYLELRERFPEFIYRDFTVEAQDGGFVVRYHFVVPGLTEFRPSLYFPSQSWPLLNHPDSPMARRILFSIGMVELVSYWKITCPPRVVVEAAYLDEAQLAWWKQLYFGGLGEFFYRNEINPDRVSFMELISTAEPAEIADKTFLAAETRLIPIGGGKDSIVTLEHLRPLHGQNLLFAINPTQASLDTMEIGGYGRDRRLLVSRTLDPEMLRLNREGYLNGHTPFSALLAFVSYFCAYLTGSTAVVLSNEASANAASVPGTEINHQYSKTSEFELAFQHYTKTYLQSEIFYFSLMRPFAEIAIARSFARYRQYFSIFRSCNVGSKQNIWCGACSKCLFVYAILSPFVEASELSGIFGYDLWNQADLMADWRKLLGAEAVKPFECVGTVEEVQYAVYLTVNARLAAGVKRAALPLLLLYAVEAAEQGLLTQLHWDASAECLQSRSPEDPLKVWHKDEQVPMAYKALISDIVEEGRFYAE